MNDGCIKNKNIYCHILEALGPVLYGRAFVTGETCASALFYKTCKLQADQLSFAAFREVYDQLTHDLVAVAQKYGFLVLEKEYLTIYTPEDESIALVVYPLDELPVQIILRFHLFAEAQKKMKQGKSLSMLRRYNGQGSGMYAILTAPRPSKKKVIGERTIFERSIIRERIEPFRDGVLEGIIVSLPQHADNWASEMTEERKRAIALIQKGEKDLLQQLDVTTKQLGLLYFLVGGSQLGAIRDKGFIPWDDDLDIGMLRKDYVSFCRHGQKLLPENYFIQLPSTDPHSPTIYARLRGGAMQYVTYYNEDKDVNKGIWADLFPFDAAPKNLVLATLQKKLASTAARAYMGLLRRREYALHDEPVHLSTCSTDGSIYANSYQMSLRADARYLSFYKWASKFFPVKLAQGVYHIAARFFNPFLSGHPKTRYASFIPSYTTIEPGDLEPLRRVPFEDLSLPVIAGAEAFLKRQYGDYSVWPEPHDRESSHGFKYLEYGNGERLYV